MIQEDLGGLEVAVDEAVGVGGLDPSGDVLPDAQHLVEGAALREPALQVAAGDQFGDQFDGALRVEHLVDPDQVGVVQALLGGGGTADPLLHGGVAVVHHLQGVVGAALEVDGSPGDGQRPLSEAGAHSVGADGLSGLQVHGPTLPQSGLAGADLWTRLSERTESGLPGWGLGPTPR